MELMTVHLIVYVAMLAVFSLRAFPPRWRTDMGSDYRLREFHRGELC